MGANGGKGRQTEGDKRPKEERTRDGVRAELERLHCGARRGSTVLTIGIAGKDFTDLKVIACFSETSGLQRRCSDLLDNSERDGNGHPGQGYFHGAVNSCRGECVSR